MKKTILIASTAILSTIFASNIAFAQGGDDTSGDEVIVAPQFVISKFANEPTDPTEPVQPESQFSLAQLANDPTDPETENPTNFSLAQFNHDPTEPEPVSTESNFSVAGIAGLLSPEDGDDNEVIVLPEGMNIA